MKRLTCSAATVVLGAVLTASWMLLPASAQVEELKDDAIDGGQAQQYFGGGFVGEVLGNGVFVQGVQMQIPGMIQSTSTAVVVSEDRQRIAAYSAPLGQWHVQGLDDDKENQAAITPTVSQDMVSVVVHGRVYAYSAKAGKWGELKIPVGDGKKLAHGVEYLTVAHGDFLSTFSAQTGTWSTIDTKLAKTVNWNDGKSPK